MKIKDIKDIKIPADMASLHNLHTFQDIISVYSKLHSVVYEYANSFLNSVLKTSKDEILSYIPESEHSLYESRSNFKLEKIIDGKCYYVDTQAKKILLIDNLHGKQTCYFENNQLIIQYKSVHYKRFNNGDRAGESTYTIIFDAITLLLISIEYRYKPDYYYSNGSYLKYISEPINIKEEKAFKKEQQKIIKKEREQLQKAMSNINFLPYNLQVVENKYQNGKI